MRFFLLIFTALMSFAAKAQTVDAQILKLNGLPTTTINSIGSPDEGDLVFNNVTKTLWQYRSGQWVDLGGGSSGQSYVFFPPLFENNGEVTIDLSGKQDVLQNGINLKTINGIDLLGSGNIGLPVSDNQQLALDGFDLSISGGNTIELPSGSVNDGAITDLSLNGEILEVAGTGTAHDTNVDFSRFALDTDLFTAGQGLDIDGSNVISVIDPVTAADRQKLDSDLVDLNNPIPDFTKQGNLLAYRTENSIRVETGIGIVNGNHLRISGDNGKYLNISENTIAIQSLNSSQRWFIGDYAGFGNTAKDSTIIAIQPLDGTDSKDLYYDYQDNRWEIGEDEILTSASGGTGGTDDQTASEVPITDSGNYFTGTDVEAALQELGAVGGGNFDTAADYSVTGQWLFGKGTADFIDSDLEAVSIVTDNLSVQTSASFNNIRLTGVSDPTSPQDAATKAYVDANSGSSGNFTFKPIGNDYDFVSSDFDGYRYLTYNGAGDGLAMLTDLADVGEKVRMRAKMAGKVNVDCSAVGGCIVNGTLQNGFTFGNDPTTLYKEGGATVSEHVYIVAGNVTEYNPIAQLNPGPNAASDPAGNEAANANGFRIGEKVAIGSVTPGSVGNNAVRFTSNAAGANWAEFEFPTESGSTYSVTFDARDSGTADQFTTSWQGFGSTGPSFAPINNGTFRSESFTVTATGTTGVIRWYTDSTDANDAAAEWMEVDNMSITKTSN